MATLGQIIFYSMVTLIVIFSAFIILILVLAFKNSSSAVLSSDAAPVANFGQDELLSCYLSVPATSAQISLTQVSVTWEKTDMNGLVYQFVNGAPNLVNQNSQFAGRTQLFPNELASGNASLLLRSVMSSDQGVYTCTISSSGGGGKVNINLRTAAFSAPTFTLSNGSLGAVANWWSPKPNVTWKDANENALDGNTSFTQNSAGIFSVVSTLQSVNMSSTYTCKIANNLVAAVSKATVTESGVSGNSYFVYSAASSLLASTYLNILTSIYYLT
ncbi:V-set domain-containing T-cell activation inhibitor 1 [Anabas testudineus]|uniref:Immunoglobulin V-set domain-containing protein n=1 Tax=Anabas testudineus TaxID=64144 RepID=A0A3Q1H0N7_ANATE|nr:V-set domain-containing T-cell activation inhibitor 1 [Anabas testudineus]